MDSSVGTTFEFACVLPGNAELEKVLESAGFTQDPDVLDTWFSSALWPHSTLGWPDQTADLARYYPTTVLLTGRDIITLWVARMVMTGLYNMGGVVPFHHVAINPTILDGNGERMSKTKGNGVDPVEIIDGYGADALRFTLTSMATETQDARMPVKKDAQGRNTSDKFDSGRNFCNKLWNAARFTIDNLEHIGKSGVAGAGGFVPARMSLPDRWIVSRLNAAVREADGALAAYRFDQYAKVCYDFFWRDFCDWYVETAKPALKNDATAGTTAAVLAATLDGALRLMHPMIPFITETIWWRLNEVCPQRTLPGVIECPASERLIMAKWPAAGAADESAETVFARIQEIVGAIRNVRNEHKADPKKPVKAYVQAPAEKVEVLGQVRESKGIIELLAVCELAVGAGVGDVAGEGARLVRTTAGCEIYVEGVIDPAAERQRKAKMCDDMNRQIAAMKARLANPGYLAKAPVHLVEQTKAQLAEAEAEVAKLSV
jgi:valyl-tRNA synthetase